MYDFFYFLFRLFKKWQTHLLFLDVEPNQEALLLSKGQTLLKVEVILLLFIHYDVTHFQELENSGFGFLLLFRH